MGIKNRKLTPKQQSFCREYLVDCNGTQAAIRAGYSKTSAAVSALKLMETYEIYSNINKLMRRQEKRTELTADYVIGNLRHIIDTSKENGDTKAYMSSVKALELLGKHLGIFEDRLRIIHDKKSDIELIKEMLTSANMLKVVLDQLNKLGYEVKVKDGHVTRLDNK